MFITHIQIMFLALGFDNNKSIYSRTRLVLLNKNLLCYVCVREKEKTNT